MKNDIIEKINLFLNETASILGKEREKKESITTTSAGVPGDGPIADVQNGLAITQKDSRAIQKNKKLLKSIMFSRISESQLSINDILTLLDIQKIIKQHNHKFSLVWTDVQKRLSSLKSQLNIQISNTDINKLKAAIEKVI